MKTAQPLNSPPLQRKRAFVVLGVLMLAVLGLLGYELWSGYQANLRDAETQARNYAAIIEARWEATLRRADAELLAVAADTPVAALHKPAVPRYLQQINADLNAHTVNFDEIVGLRIFDAAGDLLYTSAVETGKQVNIADRAYFRQLRDQPQAGLVFSEVLVGRATQHPVMILGRALSDAHGVFRGVVIAVIDLLHFQQLFEALQLGPQSVVSIRRTEDGRGVIRSPALGRDVNQPLPATSPIRQMLLAGATEGRATFASIADGQMRLYRFRVVPRYPFYVSVGLAQTDVLVDWRQTAWVVGLSSLLLLGAFVTMLSRLWRTEGRMVRARARLAASEERTRLLAKVFQHSGEALMITDRDNRILDVNRAFSQVTGYTLEEIRGQDPRLLASGRTSQAEYQVMWRAIHEEGLWQGEIWDRNKNGELYPKWLTISVIRGEDGAIDYHIANFIDISERKKTEEQMAHLAHHDALTGLPNRHSLQYRLEQVIASARRGQISATAERQDSRVALMFIDMDRFKSINDTLGHHVGDGLLKEVATRLRRSVRDSDVVARLGGDEFVVVLVGVDPAAAAMVAGHILATLGQPYCIEGHELNSSPSIGIAIFPEDATNVDDLLKHADAAMYRAKSAGRNRFEFFAPS